MDGSSFDKLARLAATGAPRRGVLRSGFALIGAGLGLTSLLEVEDAAAKSCKKKCNKKKDSKARRKCKKKCNKKDDGGGGGGGTGGGQKQPGTLCGNSSECVPPFICALPLNDSGGDKRCCGASGAPCGGDDANLDDLPPICCQGFICSTDGQGTSTPGTCQPAP